MATQESLDLVQYAYIAFYGRPADPAGQVYWAEQLDAAEGDLSAIINAFATSEEYDEQYGDLTNEELVNALYQQILGRDAEEDGLNYYVGELEAGNITKGEIALAILNGATGDDAATMANRKAVADAFTAAVEAGDKAYGDDQIPAAKTLLAAVGADTDPADVNVDRTVDSFPDATDPTAPSEPGETFQLTDGREGSGRDVLTGTDGDDTFLGLVGQNSEGAVANAFSTGDWIDGGAGRDRIEATMINDNEVFGDVNSDPRPITKNVEEVYIEALEDVTLDATRMEGVEEFWSDFSRGDMTFTGVNLRGSNLNITKDVTFGIKDTMHGTNFTALFDSLSLTREASNPSNSQLLVRIADVSTETPDTPLANVNLNLSFDLGGVTVDLENVQSTDGTYAGLVTAIQNALALEGYAGLTVELSTPYNQVTFANNTVTLPFTAQEILITDPAGNDFANVSFTQSAIQPVAGGFLVAGNAQPLDPAETSNLIESNLILDNAGNGSLAGDVEIGGMSNSGLGVEKFNVSVDRSSSILSLETTNNALQEIEISSQGVEGDLYIGGTQDNLNEIDANAFTGENLSLGEDSAVSDLLFLDAANTSANITFVADYDGNGRASSEQAFVINTGSGNDNITADLTGTSTSGSTTASLTVSATGGDNTVVLSSTAAEDNAATVTLGSGADTVTGGMTHLTANTGSGDDVIYAENTGDKTVAFAAAGDWQGVVGTTAMGAGVLVDNAELLYGRQVQVTLGLPGMNPSDSFVKGLEATFDIAASNGYLTTERDLYEAAANAINNDPVLSTLATAEVDSNGNLIVTYLIDGATAATDKLVQIEVLGDWTDVASAAQSNIVDALQEKYADSTIDETDAGNGYGANTGAGVETFAAVTAIGSDSTIGGGENIVNAGLGNDVIVLSSDDNTVDTVVFDGQFGTNTVVHFNDASGGDVLDFTAWLDNVTSASKSVESQVRIATALEDQTTTAGGISANDVVVTTFAILDGAITGTTLDFDTLTGADVLAALNEAGGYEVEAAVTNFVGGVQKSILMVENTDNEGEYKVFEVSSDTTAGDNFTAVTLVGTVDFGAQLNVAGMDDTNVL